MKKVFEILKNTNVWMLLLTVAMTILGVTDVSAILTANAVVVPGVEGVGVTVTGEPLSTEIVKENSADLNRPTIDDMVTKMFPSKTPIDQVTRLIGRKKTAKSMDFKFYSADTRPIEANVTAAYTENGASESGYISVDNPDLFNITDTIMVTGVKGYDSTGVNQISSDVVLYVSGKDSSSPQKLQVLAFNGKLVSSKITVPSIPNGTVLYRLGTAAVEGDIQSYELNTLPTPQINYCQIFKVQVGETTIEKLTNKEVEWDLSDSEEMAFYDFRRGIEASFLFGAKGIKKDANNKNRQVYATQGIYWQIAKSFTIPAVPTNGDLIDMSKYVFTGQSGSRKKILLMGSEFNAGISKINSIQKQLEAKNTELKWGITWNIITTNFGEFYGMPYDFLDQVGKSDEAIIIDPDYIDKWTLIALGTNDISEGLKKTGIFDGNVRVTTEVSGLALRYPSAHCKVKLQQIIKVTGVTTSGATHAVAIGETYGFGATLTVAPSNATNKGLTYQTSNAAKATVDANGVVTGIGAGTAVISGTTADGNFTAVCTVTVS